MNLPADSLITRSIDIMNAQLAARIPGEDVTQLRSGLFYMGNVQDAYPRQLLLDSRLSPLDKLAWMMIRLYAQQNQGAVFPTYDELQLQLASPQKGKASRETVSRVLLMLRITGWLSLCKRVRDEKGRVKGNIYAQHDEPLSCRDAESFDPGWLDMLAEACHNKNHTIRQSALSVLHEIKDDTTMRHRHSAVTQIENRLRAPQTPQEMAARQYSASAPAAARHHPGSVTELSENTSGNLSSDTELSHLSPHDTLSSVSELSLKSDTYARVREPNCNVRSFTQGVNKKTYVNPGEGAMAVLTAAEFSLLATLTLTDKDRDMVTRQLQALPDEARAQVLTSLESALAGGNLGNPAGWLFAVLKRAREGKLFATQMPARPAKNTAVPTTASSSAPFHRPAVRHLGTVSTAEHVGGIVAEIRRRMAERT